MSDNPVSEPMSKHRLNPITPLGHDAPETVTIGTVTLAENPGVALASLAIRAGQEKPFRAAAKKAGIPLPEAGHAEWGVTWGAIWTGPGQWMAEAPFASHEDIVAVLRPVFGETASVTEQTDGWARIEVTGPDLPALFERLTNFDLQAAAPGAATRTAIEHVGCLLALRAPGHVTLLAGRSSAGSLWHALETAAQSVA